MDEKKMKRMSTKRSNKSKRAKSEINLDKNKKEWLGATTKIRSTEE